MDKIKMKKLLTYHEIPTADWDYAYRLTDKINDELEYPLIVKPANSDNLVGVSNSSIVTTAAELAVEMRKIIEQYGRPALIEEFIEGDEYEVAILGSEEENNLQVLPLTRSIFKLPKGFWPIYPFDYRLNNAELYRNYITIQRPPKKINKKMESLITEIALDTYNILDCHDYGYVIIRVDKNNNPYVVELMPNPSMHPHDTMSNAAGLLKFNHGDLIEEIIRMAIERYKNHPPYYHLQSGMM